jgi:hypothetical protein
MRSLSARATSSATKMATRSSCDREGGDRPFWSGTGTIDHAAQRWRERLKSVFETAGIPEDMRKPHRFRHTLAKGALVHPTHPRLWFSLPASWETNRFLSPTGITTSSSRSGISRLTPQCESCGHKAAHEKRTQRRTQYCGHARAFQCVGREHPETHLSRSIAKVAQNQPEKQRAQSRLRSWTVSCSLSNSGVRSHSRLPRNQLL